MIIDARKIPSGTAVETDVCVVGAGAAGIALALELNGGPLRVALLESGGLDFELKLQDLNRGDVVGLPYFPLESARLRYLGGSTNHWGGLCRPFLAADFERRSWLSPSGWPISISDVHPYYRRAGRICGVNAWEPYEEGENRPATSLLAGSSFLMRVAQRVDGIDRRFGANYLDELRNSRNVTTHLYANVLEIRSTDNARTARAVAVRTLAKNTFTVTARAFVLAAGGIENARILLVSTDRQANGLGNQDDVVGRYFLEHPRFVAGVIVPSDSDVRSKPYGWYRRKGIAIRSYIVLPAEVQEREGLNEVQLRLEPVRRDPLAALRASDQVRALGALLKSAGRGRLPDDAGRHVQAVAQDLTRWQQFALPGAPIPVPRPEVVGRLVQSRGDILAQVPLIFGNITGFALSKLTDATLDSFTVTAILQPTPNPLSRVMLSNDRDALGVRRVKLDWRLTAADKRSVRRTMEILGQEVGRLGAGRLKLIVSEDQDTWPSDLAGGWHLMGTTRMSDDPKQGVVDRNCRVHGMTNLYVAGSSVFATSGSGTPTLMLVALALRLAAHLNGAFA
jgi:choline dehydrogenase-like flavoprotein